MSAGEFCKGCPFAALHGASSDHLATSHASHQMDQRPASLSHHPTLRMHAEPYCLACFNTELSLVHGVLVCDACGTQAEAPVEEEEFLDAGGPPGAFRRRRMVVPGGSGSGPQIRQDELADRESEQAQIRGQALTYAKCLQALIQVQRMVMRGGKPQNALSLRESMTCLCAPCIMQAQAHALVEQLGLPPGIRTLLRRLWLSHLPLSGVLELSIEQVWV
jgi:hypothetical protein